MMQMNENGSKRPYPVEKVVHCTVCGDFVEVEITGKDMKGWNIGYSISETDDMWIKSEHDWYCPDCVRGTVTEDE